MSATSEKADILFISIIAIKYSKLPGKIQVFEQFECFVHPRSNPARFKYVPSRLAPTTPKKSRNSCGILFSGESIQVVSAKGLCFASVQKGICLLKMQ